VGGYWALRGCADACPNACPNATKVNMFGLNTYISLALTVAILLAVVIGLPWMRNRMRRLRQESPEESVPPLNSVRSEQDTGPQDRT